VAKIGPRLELVGDPDMQRVGEAVHGFLAADDPAMEPAERLEMAGHLLEQWGVPSALAAEELMQASDALLDRVKGTFLGGVLHREWPVLHRLEGGSVVRGEADLMVETGEGLYLIDHKSFAGNPEQAVERAARVAGQVLAYADAVVAATGKQALGCYVHLPISGLIVLVEAAT
jgi:ATP-dependent helicase/nuclease subunit A